MWRNAAIPYLTNEDLGVENINEDTFYQISEATPLTEQSSIYRQRYVKVRSVKHFMVMHDVYTLPVK